MPESKVLSSPNRHKEYVASGRLVTMVDRKEAPAPQGKEAAGGQSHRVPSPPEILTIDELAKGPIEGIDEAKVLNEMADIGPQARLLIYRKGGEVVRYEVFEDPRICLDLYRGAVIENLEETPKDVSGWRTHEFFIDTKGCLGDECGRCAIVCPENAIHLMGKGKGSFHEIDPLACKGCFICWVECVRTAADCILVDGKTFDASMRAKHFGE